MQLPIFIVRNFVRLSVNKLLSIDKVQTHTTTLRFNCQTYCPKRNNLLR